MFRRFIVLSLNALRVLILFYLLQVNENERPEKRKRGSDAFLICSIEDGLKLWRKEKTPLSAKKAPEYAKAANNRSVRLNKRYLFDNSLSL